jgi:Cdk activating kinase (CAK)/RNA polymerase II transcription initiation/nucleotide excision repair factor TFIIH/TFIIK, cyclin H subunit
MATTAVFLASKTTEQIVKIKDLAFAHLNIQKSKLENGRGGSKPITEDMIEKLGKSIILYEFHLLAILDYNLLAPLPYSDIFKIVSTNYSAIFLRVSNNFANDSFRTRACLNHSALEIAETCCYLAAEFLEIKVDIVPNMLIVEEILFVFKDFI